MVKALWEQGLLPRVISGASAGSIVTALVGYVYMMLMIIVIVTIMMLTMNDDDDDDDDNGDDVNNGDDVKI